MTDRFPSAHPELAQADQNLPQSEGNKDDGESMEGSRESRVEAGTRQCHTSFPEPINKGGGFDVHVYYNQLKSEQVENARALRSRIISEFPELRVHRIDERPRGVHPLPNFEVNIFTPEQYGTFIPWLVMNRNGLSVFVHPNTTELELELNHTQRAMWLGERTPLDLRVFKHLRPPRPRTDVTDGRRSNEPRSLRYSNGNRPDVNKALVDLGLPGFASVAFGA